MMAMQLLAQCVQKRFDVGETCGVEVVVQADEDVKPRDRIEFQFPNSWMVITGPSYTRELQGDKPDHPHFISVTTPEGAETRFALTIKPRHLNYPEGEVRHGRLVTAELVSGAIPAGTPIHIRYANTFAPYVAETDALWLRVNGQAPETEPVLTVIAGAHQCFRVIVPSYAVPGEDFDVFIVSLDRFENASSTVFEDERLTRTDGAVIAEHLRLSGSLRVRTRIDQDGVYRFRFRDTVSNAVKVAMGTRKLYWGDLHIHTKLSHDGQGTDPYVYAREVSALDFAGVSDHWEALGPEGYRRVTEWADQAHCPGAFVTVLGDERNSKELTGDHNIYFRDAETMARYRAIRTEGTEAPPNTFTRLQEADPSRVMLVPHHTGINWGELPQGGGIGRAIAWDVCDDRGLRPVMEIYSQHGQSELYDPQHLLAYEFNRMHNPERRANTSVPGPYYAQDYWMAGKRVGVIGSSDEHSGQGGRRHGGVAAVFAKTLTREEIFDGMLHRTCYATTGERILVEFAVDDLGTGSVGKRQRGDKLKITLNVWGTDTLLRVDLMRFRKGVDKTFRPVLSTAPRPERMDAMITFDDLVETSCLYYARIVQAPLTWPAMAWTSPIWIDIKEGQ
ncbi:MAG: DUF3604 domain-containing protein [Lentisphaerae bacterium]|nr:DUF3604 domain-containing protein [Lentisphaerota bacterium]